MENFCQFVRLLESQVDFRLRSRSWASIGGFILSMIDRNRKSTQLSNSRTISWLTKKILKLLAPITGDVASTCRMYSTCITAQLSMETGFLQIHVRFVYYSQTSLLLCSCDFLTEVYFWFRSQVSAVCRSLYRMTAILQDMTSEIHMTERLIQTE